MNKLLMTIIVGISLQYGFISAVSACPTAVFSNSQYSGHPWSRQPEWMKRSAKARHQKGGRHDNSESVAESAGSNVVKAETTSETAAPKKIAGNEKAVSSEAKPSTENNIEKQPNQ